MTYEFFKVLGVEPLIGRSFTPDEDQPNGVVGAGVTVGLIASAFIAGQLGDALFGVSARGVPPGSIRCDPSEVNRPSRKHFGLIRRIKSAYRGWTQ